MRPGDALPEGISCRVFLGEDLLFESRSHWLHPLFELNDFLSGRGEIDREDLFLRDRIIGRAAALMILRLGIRRCATERISSRALPVFTEANMTCDYGTVLPRLDCMTEEILAEERDPERAWALLAERASKPVTRKP